MRVSKNEISALLKQVFEGIGFRCGEYENAADMVVWAQMCGLAGLQELRHALPHLIEHTPPALRNLTENKNQAELDANGGSSLNCADVVMNLAYTKALSQGFSTVTVHNCHNRKLFSKAIADCGKKEMACLAYWRNASDPVTLHVISAAGADDMPRYTTRTLGEQSPIQDEHRQSLFIVCSTRLAELDDYKHTIFPAQDDTETTAQPSLLRDRYHASLMQGLSIELDLWQQLQSLAKIVLVESSEQSRMGAGA